MIIKKNNEPKSIEMIVADITYSFTKLIAQKNPILSITIKDTLCKTKEELRFNLTNKFFNRMKREYKNTPEIFNYLFVIEYPKMVATGNFIPTTCVPHAHIILETTIPSKTVEFYAQDCFKTDDIKIDPINKRTDKENYINYLTKQRHLFDNDTYNYKITIN